MELLPAGQDKLFDCNARNAVYVIINDGNQQDYGMRIYDPRIGKFLSVDPLSREYPWNSPYAFAENDPLNFIDLDGLEKAKKQTLTNPVYKKVEQSDVARIVSSNSVHVEHRKATAGKTWSIGAREYGYIATSEDLSLSMYDNDGDKNGNATIGFGYLIHSGRIGNTPANEKLEEPYKNGITEEKAVGLMFDDIHEKEGYINKYLEDEDMVGDVTGRQYTALVDIAMNMGQSNAKKIIKLLKTDGAEAAANKIRSWKPEKGGLRNRREFEARLLENKELVTKTQLEVEATAEKKSAAASKKAEKKSKKKG